MCRFRLVRLYRLNSVLERMLAVPPLSSKYFVRANKLGFIAKVLEKLIVWQRDGVKVRVGGGTANPDQSVLKTAFIFLSSIMGDAQELDMYAGTSFKNGKAPCRLCLQVDCVNCIQGQNICECRNQDIHEEVCHLSGQAQIAEWENIALKNLKRTLHIITSDQKRCMAQAAMYGLVCQSQPLFRQFRMQVIIFLL